MLCGKTPDTTIFDQACERALHCFEPIRCCGVTVDFSPCHKRQATRKVPIVIQVLSLIDPVDRPVVRVNVEIPLLVSPRLLQPTRNAIPHPLGADRFDQFIGI